MKAVAPYVISAALILPTSSATMGAIAEPLPAAHAFYYSDAIDPIHDMSGSPTFSVVAALGYPQSPGRQHPGQFVEDESEPYEPFIAAEAWREIPAPEAPVKIVFEGHPASFFDEHDLAAIAIYE